MINNELFFRVTPQGDLPQGKATYTFVLAKAASNKRQSVDQIQKLMDVLRIMQEGTLVTYTPAPNEPAVIPGNQLNLFCVPALTSSATSVALMIEDYDYRYADAITRRIGQHIESIAAMDVLKRQPGPFWVIAMKSTPLEDRDPLLVADLSSLSADQIKILVDTYRKYVFMHPMTGNPSEYLKSLNAELKPRLANPFDDTSSMLYLTSWRVAQP